jgi:hypothetical protein
MLIIGVGRNGRNQRHLIVLTHLGIQCLLYTKYSGNLEGSKCTEALIYISTYYTRGLNSGAHGRYLFWFHVLSPPKKNKAEISQLLAG